jgi:type I restriction enzyme S subunit
MEKQKYKQTEIGEIPEDWYLKTIGDIFQFEGGSQPVKDNFIFQERGGYVRLLQIRDYKNDKYVTYIPIKSARRFCKKDDIMIGRYGPPIFQILSGLEGAYNVALIKAIPSSECNKEFVRFILKQSNIFTFVEKLSQRSSGQTGIDLFELRKYNVAFPPTKKEQTAIATVLSDTDELITSLDKLIAKKKAIKQGAMQELLTGKKRLPRFSGEWKEKALQELVDFSNGKAHETFISKDGRFIVVNSKFISSNGEVVKYSNKAFALAPAKSVLMVMSDVPNGKAIAKCFIVEEESKYTVNQRICCLVPNIDPKFLFYKINRNPWYLSFDDGVKQTNLRKEDVLTCKLTLPVDHQEQVAISTILSNMDSELESLEKKRDKYLMIKQGMMQQLLTGKIRLI